MTNPPMLDGGQGRTRRSVVDDASMFRWYLAALAAIWLILWSASRA